MAFLSASYPLNEQQKFNHFLLEKMGVDLNRARLDFSAHPFCTGFNPHDVRFTTFTSTTSFFNSIFAVLHEGGHALYELGLPYEDLGTPLADACSLGVHESQSRWWECFIGQGRPLWEFAFPHLEKAFPKQLKGVTLDHFINTINHVEPSLIRVYADEVTYILHIIIRYEIEKEFITGSIDLADLPRIWNKKMEESLGIVPKHRCRWMPSRYPLGFWLNWIFSYLCPWESLLRTSLRNLHTNFSKLCNFNSRWKSLFYPKVPLRKKFTVMAANSTHLNLLKMPQGLLFPLNLIWII